MQSDDTISASKDVPCIGDITLIEGCYDLSRGVH